MSQPSAGSDRPNRAYGPYELRDKLSRDKAKAAFKLLLELPELAQPAKVEKLQIKSIRPQLGQVGANLGQAGANLTPIGAAAIPVKGASGASGASGAVGGASGASGASGTTAGPTRATFGPVGGTTTGASGPSRETFGPVGGSTSPSSLSGITETATSGPIISEGEVVQGPSANSGLADTVESLAMIMLGADWNS